MLCPQMARTYRQVPINRPYRCPVTFKELKARVQYKEDLVELDLTLQARVYTRYVPSAHDDRHVGSYREHYPYKRWYHWYIKNRLKYTHLSHKELLARSNCNWVKWYEIYKQTKNNARR
jgi:hypothetical protein